MFLKKFEVIQFFCFFTETNKTNNRGHLNAVLPKPQPASERINKGNLPESSSSQSKPTNITITTAPLKSKFDKCSNSIRN